MNTCDKNMDLFCRYTDTKECEEDPEDSGAYIIDIIASRIKSDKEITKCKEKTTRCY